MKLKQLEFGTVKDVYYKYLCHDFIPSEQKPLIVIQILMKMGLYRCYGLYEEDIFCGYAFFFESGCGKKKSVLLDYLVVLKENRSKGYGSKLIQLMKEEFQEYDFIIAEVERVEAEVTKDERNIRERRRNFYINNGFITTDLFVNLFGEQLQIYVMELCSEYKKQIIKEELNLIYDKMFYEPQVRENVKLYE